MVEERKLLEAINRVFSAEQIPSVELAGLVTTAADFADPGAVANALRGFGGSGWITVTDELVVVQDGPLPDLSGRIVLGAELSVGQRSLHVRQYKGAWRGWLIERRDPSSDAPAYAVVRQQYVPTNARSRQVMLAYEVYWSDAQTSVMAPVAYRFAGFVPVVDRRADMGETE